jgi:hypothetical protein
MANNNAAYGFVPVDPLPQVTTYTIASGYGTAINTGDPVALTGTGSGQYAGLAIGVSGSDVVGIFCGVEYTDSNGITQFQKSWPASTVATNIRAMVYDDPDTKFKVQANGSVAVTDYGRVANFATGTGTQGLSGYTVDASSFGSGTDFQVTGAYTAIGNSVGTYEQLVGYLAKHTLNYPHTAV